MSEQRLDLTLGEAEHVVLHSLAEFKFIEGQRVVVVHDTELLGKTDDAASTTALQLVAQALEKVISAGLATSRGATDIPTEDLAGELTVIESATLILVVEVVEGVQILTSYENKITKDLTSWGSAERKPGSAKATFLQSKARSACWSGATSDELTCLVGIMIPIFSTALANSSGSTVPLLFKSKYLKALRSTVSSLVAPEAF